MKLAVLNGSPRGEKSNSLRMAQWVLGPESKEKITNINKPINHQNVIEETLKADTLLFIFPLYVDSMPGQVKAFFELMEKNKVNYKEKSVSFIIHSGFPERVHCYNLMSYLEYFSEMMEMNYLGTVIMAGSESLQMAPDNFYRRQLPLFRSLYSFLERGEKIPEGITKKLSKTERQSKLASYLYKINPFKNFYWNYRANQHGFKGDLRARPY